MRPNGGPKDARLADSADRVESNRELTPDLLKRLGCGLRRDSFETVFQHHLGVLGRITADTVLHEDNMVAMINGLDDKSENTHVQGYACRDHRIHAERPELGIEVGTGKRGHAVKSHAVEVAWFGAELRNDLG